MNNKYKKEKQDLINKLALREAKSLSFFRSIEASLPHTMKFWTNIFDIIKSEDWSIVPDKKEKKND